MCVAVHLEEGAERSPLDGDDRAEEASEALQLEADGRDLFTESLYEYGSRRGIWRLLDTLDGSATPATFFCAGQALERNPTIAPAVLAAGHEIAGHGHRWLPYNELDEDSERADIHRAVHILQAATGETPTGWRSRVPSPRTRRLLRDAGVTGYDADGHAADTPYYAPLDPDEAATAEGAQRWTLVVPPTAELDDRKFWAPVRTVGYQGVDDFVASAIATLEWLVAEARSGPALMGLTVHARISGRPERALALRRILEHARAQPDVWMARFDDVARHWASHVPPERQGQ